MVEREGVHWSGEERVDLYGMGKLLVRSEVVGRMILLIAFEGLQQEVKPTILDFVLIFFELAHALRGVANFRQHA